MYDYQSQPEPFQVSTGFIAFIAALFLPFVFALFIYLGAWAVSDEVYAAEAPAQQPGFNTASANSDVAGWKHTLVGVCPLH